MENLKANGQETSTFKTIPIAVGIGSHNNGKGCKELSCNMVSPCPGPVGRSSFSQVKKQLEKLERDYQHTYEKYTELQSDWSRYYSELRSSKYHSRWAGYCIDNIKNVVEQLQIVLDKLNTEEATQRGREMTSHVQSKQFFLTHSCKSLSQEKKILQLVPEKRQHYNDGLSQETIDVKRINEKFRYIQRIVPKTSSKKPIHDLLRRVKETKKLTEKAIIANGALVGNRTSQDNMENSTRMEIKFLKKVIKDLEKERGNTDNFLQDNTRIENGYSKKMTHLEEKCECIVKKRDAEKKHLLDLEKTNRLSQKTGSKRRSCRKE